MPYSPEFHRKLFDNEGKTLDVRIVSRTAMDAILAGNGLMREHPNCSGFGLHNGEIQIYAFRQADAA